MTTPAWAKKYLTQLPRHVEAAGGFEPFVVSDADDDNPSVFVYVYVGSVLIVTRYGSDDEHGILVEIDPAQARDLADALTRAADTASDNVLPAPEVSR